MAEQDPIEAYIAGFDTSQQQQLTAMDRILRDVLPDAQCTIAWRMPTYRGRVNIIHFAGFKHHVGLYPGADGVAQFADELQEAGYKFSKGAIQFPYDQPLLTELIERIARWCLAHHV